MVIRRVRIVFLLSAFAFLLAACGDAEQEAQQTDTIAEDWVATDRPAAAHDGAPETQHYGRDAERCESLGVHSFAVIQERVFEARGCTSSECHGGASAGGLDLRREVAWANLYEVPSSSGERSRVKPGAAAESTLYRKLLAATRPGTAAITGDPMPRGRPPLSEDELAAIALWIDKGAPMWGAVSDAAAGSDVRSLLEPTCGK